MIEKGEEYWKNYRRDYMRSRREKDKSYGQAWKKENRLRYNVHARLYRKRELEVTK